MILRRVDFWGGRRVRGGCIIGNRCLLPTPFLLCMTALPSSRNQCSPIPVNILLYSHGLVLLLIQSNQRHLMLHPSIRLFLRNKAVNQRRRLKVGLCVVWIVITGIAAGLLLEFGSPVVVACVATLWAVLSTIAAIVAIIRPTQ